MRVSLFLSAAAMVALGSMSFALVGCGKSPEAVCKRFDELDKSKKKQKVEDCTKEMAQVKEKAPKGYDCIAKCTEKTSEEDAVKCVAECAKNDKDLEKVMGDISKQRAEQDAKEEAEKMAGWPKLKEKSFDGALGDLKYSITLADGFAEDKGGGDIMKSYKFDTGEEFQLGPGLNLTKGFGDDVEQAAGMLMGGEKPIKKEKTDTGYVLTAAGDDSIRAEVLVKNGDKSIKCSITQFGKAGVQKKDDLLPWFEKMCKSVKPQ